MEPEAYTDPVEQLGEPAAASFCYRSYAFTDRVHHTDINTSHSPTENLSNDHEYPNPSSQSKGGSGLRWGKIKHSIRRLIPSDDTIRLSNSPSRCNRDSTTERENKHTRKTFDFSTILEAGDEEALKYEEQKSCTHTPFPTNYDEEMFSTAHGCMDHQFNDIDGPDDESLQSNPVPVSSIYLTERRQDSEQKNTNEELEKKLKTRLQVIVALKDALIQQRNAMLLVKSENEWQKEQLDLSVERSAYLERQNKIQQEQILQIESERDSYAMELLWSKEEARTLKSEVEKMKKERDDCDKPIKTTEEKLQDIDVSTKKESQEKRLNGVESKIDLDRVLDLGQAFSTQTESLISDTRCNSADEKCNTQDCPSSANAFGVLKKDIEQTKSELTAIRIKPDNKESEIHSLETKKNLLQEPQDIEKSPHIGCSLDEHGDGTTHEEGEPQEEKSSVKNVTLIAGECKQCSGKDDECTDSNPNLSSHSQGNPKGDTARSDSTGSFVGLIENRYPQSHRDVQQSRNISRS